MTEKRKILYINPELSVDVIHKNIKNMHLSVLPPDAKVRVSAPLRVSEETVRLFIISKIEWIRKHQRNFQAQDREHQRVYKEQESHYFQGRRYLLRITEHDAPPKVVLQSKTHLDLYVRADRSTPENREAVLKAWYRSELKKLIPPIIEKWEQQIGVTVAEWRIKQMRTRWGTCNIARKRIWLNLELGKKPLHCLEYVVVHEMVHLLERRHNERFFTLMEKYIPQWKYYKKELNSLTVNHETGEETEKDNA